MTLDSGRDIGCLVATNPRWRAQLEMEIYRGTHVAIVALDGHKRVSWADRWGQAEYWRDGSRQYSQTIPFSSCYNSVQYCVRNKNVVESVRKSGRLTAMDPSMRFSKLATLTKGTFFSAAQRFYYLLDSRELPASQLLYVLLSDLAAPCYVVLPCAGESLEFPCSE